MPRRERQGQQNLIFDQTGDIEFLARFDRVGGLRVVDVFSRFSAARYEQYCICYVYAIIETLQTALTLQVQRTANPDLELSPAALVAAAAQLVIEAALGVEQKVFQSFQTGDGQAAAQNLTGEGELQTVDLRRRRHKPRMIVFLPFRVKTRRRKAQFQQALRLIDRVPPAMFVLASSSAYRRSLLERLNFPFITAAPNVDETPLAGESAHATAVRLAEEKAREVAKGYAGHLVIGSDQVAVLDDMRLGKPGTYERALAQLAAVRGRSVVFHTAVCLFDARSDACQVEDVPTTVHFRQYTDAQASSYLKADRPYDCAGSAKIESLGIALVDRVESADPSALIGLPLIALVTMLQHAGFEVLA